jgi:hypothetical protein
MKELLFDINQLPLPFRVKRFQVDGNDSAARYFIDDLFHNAKIRCIFNVQTNKRNGGQ